MNVPESYSKSPAESVRSNDSYPEKTSKTSKTLKTLNNPNISKTSQLSAYTPQQTQISPVNNNMRTQNQKKKMKTFSHGKVSEAAHEHTKPDSRQKKQKLSPVTKLKNKFRKNKLGIIDSYFNAYFIYFLKKSEKKEHEFKEHKSRLYKKNIYDRYICLMIFIARFVGAISFVPAKIKKAFQPKTRILTNSVVPIEKSKETNETLEVKNAFARIILPMAAAASIALTAFIIIHINSFQLDLQIYIDGESIGLVNSVQNLDSSISIAEQNISSALGAPYKLSVNISYKIVLTKNPVYLSNFDLHNALYNFSQDAITSAYGLYFDGKLIGAALCEEDIDTVLQQILYEQNELDKTDIVYIPEDPNGVPLASYSLESQKVQETQETQSTELVEAVEVNEEHFEFLNEVRVIQAKFPKKAIISPTELKIAIEIAADSKLAISSTIDNALTEAHSANTISRDYVRSYPATTFSPLTSSSAVSAAESSYYFASNVLLLGAALGDFDVQFKKIKSETTLTEVPFAIEYKESDDYYQNTKIVEVTGVNGEEEIISQVTYVNDIEIARNILGVTALREPVNQVVIIGTKELPSTNPTGKLVCPVAYRYMTDKFAKGGHRGVDFIAPYGTKIVAADGGTVVFSGESASYGLYVVVRHSKGVETLYAHMSERLVAYGEKVYQGQPIGKVGSTGNSTGNHLHFEVQMNGTLVDPLAHIGK